MTRRFVCALCCGLLVILASCKLRTFTTHFATMNPTIRPGDKIVANMLAYSFHGPRRWDIVLFHPKESQNKDDLLTMRVVGLAGEKISFSDEGRIVINDQRVRVPSAITSVQFKAIDSSRVRIIDGPIPVF